MKITDEEAAKRVREQAAAFGREFARDPSLREMFNAVMSPDFLKEHGATPASHERK